MRGLYRWHDQDRAPIEEPSLNEYRRLDWVKLEPEEGKYNFDLIEGYAAKAAAQGHTFSFRICPANAMQGCLIPKYLVDQMPGAFVSYKPDGRTVAAYVPDWNAPIYRERAAKLVEALGKRFDGDPRIAWIEIGLYGNWGEWHNFGFGVPPSKVPDGASATKHAIIGMHVRAFPRTQLLMMTDDADGLLYALSLSPRIGIRRDSLGVPLFAAGLQKNPQKWAAVRDRWKTAPFITEPIGGYNPPQDFRVAAQQVREFHVSAVGNGNLTFKDLSPEERAALYDMARASGYRYVLDSAAFPSEAHPGDRLALRTRWRNIGVAPCYQMWSVTFSLRDAATGRIVWSGISSMDLRRLLPDSSDKETADDFALPADLPSGRYTLSLTIEDPAHYYRPLAPAIEGRQADGSYPLGEVRVR